jgi:hypothetical protein
VTVGNLITLPALIIQREFPAASFATLTNLSRADDRRGQRAVISP